MAEQFRNFAGLIPHELYREGKAYVKHNGIPEESVHQYLEGHDLSYYFDSNGKLIFKSPLDLYNLPSDRIMPLMARDLGKYMNHAQESLLKGHYGLFNAHRWLHVKQVGEEASALAAQFGASEDTQKNAKIGGALHDVGNLPMREEHERLGGLMAVDMYPALANDPDRAIQIVGAINHHNEGFWRRVRNYAGRPVDERIRCLQNSFTDISAVVAIADKADQGRGRIERTARNRQTIDRHIHSRVNFFAESQGLHYDPQQNTLSWDLQFNPYISQKESRIFGNLIERQEDDRYVAYTPLSIAVDNDPRLGASYETVLKETLQLYGPGSHGGVSRIGFMADAALTLGIDNFVMRYNDATQQHEPVEFVFNQDTADYTLEQMVQLAAH